MNKRILILYTSVGLGHKSIAENIGRQLSEAGYDVRLEDVLQVQNGWLVTISKKVHHFLSVSFPFLWSFLYQNKWFIKNTLSWRTKVAAKNFHNTQLIIDGFSPDVVITTQTTASAVVAYLKQQSLYTGLFGVAFSDFHLHEYWLYDEADFYLANTSEQKNQMVILGIPAGKIFVCGMTLPPKAVVNREAAKNKFDISAIDKVILVSSGSLGTGINKQLLKNLSAFEHRRVIVICGKNQSTYEELEDYFAGTNVTVLGYYSPMDELYAIADIFISKPGGLSVSEALNWNLPILISHMLPGQEELNFEYLEEKGLVMPEPLTIEGEATDELEQGIFRKKLIDNPSKQELLPNDLPVVQALNSLLKED